MEGIKHRSSPAIAAAIKCLQTTISLTETTTQTTPGEQTTTHWWPNQTTTATTIIIAVITIRLFRQLAQ